MSIYDRTVRGVPVNPARALYNYWHNILSNSPHIITRDGALHSDMPWGSGWWRISYQHYPEKNLTKKPPITYGGFTVRSDGAFKLGSHHGYKQRDILARDTFVRWGHVHGQYVWWIDTTRAEGDYGNWFLREYMKPIPYVIEKVAGGQSWRAPGPWLMPVWTGHQWEITYHEAGETVYTQHPGLTREEFEAHIALREKRYRRYEREHLIQTGVLTRVERRQVVSTEQIEQNKEVTLQAIIANMQIDQPARTVRLRKATEEVGLWEPLGAL